MAGEALGYLAGPIAVMIMYKSTGMEGVMLLLAVFVASVWLASIIIMCIDYGVYYQNPSEVTQET